LATDGLGKLARNPLQPLVCDALWKLPGWQHVSFDFKAMPKESKDKNVNGNVFIVIDRLGKRALSLPCTREGTAATAAKLYYEYPWRMYGAPETITSDRGPKFISAFTDELCKLTGVKQKHSTAYIPPPD
jgi:hypothetical protein